MMKKHYWTWHLFISKIEKIFSEMFRSGSKNHSYAKIKIKIIFSFREWIFSVYPFLQNTKTRDTKKNCKNSNSHDIYYISRSFTLWTQNKNSLLTIKVTKKTILDTLFTWISYEFKVQNKEQWTLHSRNIDSLR